MADQPKVLKRRKKKETREDKQEPTKQENEVGKYLRFNCPSKTSSMHGQKVEYFIGSKAVDCLLDSKWASGKSGTEILFTDRVSVETYLDRLLLLGFFSRVVRIKKVKKNEKEKEKEGEKEKESKKEKEEAESKKTSKKRKKEKTEEGKKDDDGSGQAKEKSTEGAGEGEPKKKRKIKVKLELYDPEDQYFVDDDDETFVWYFDPVHPKTFILGALVVIATIAICLFPLWPSNIREYVWYLSVLAAAAVGSILLLAVLRYVFFAIVWVCTWGKHHFWLLPNLTEECGFFESFVPLYTHEYKAVKTENEPGENGNEKENGHSEEKEKEGDGNKEESAEDKDQMEQESWVKLTEEEVATARSEVDKELEQANDTSASEVKC